MWPFLSPRSSPDRSISVENIDPSQPTSLSVKSLFPPFYPDRWTAVDDRVRGGSSVSHLELWVTDVLSKSVGSCPIMEGDKLAPSSAVTNGSDGGDVSAIGDVDEVKVRGVRFWGHLDTQTLGGAGFASQSYTFPTRLSLPESSYSGLQIDLLPSVPSQCSQLGSSSKPHQPDQFTLVLKSEKPAKREDGRREAVLSYEYTFSAPASSAKISDLAPSSSSTSTPYSLTSISIPWTGFSATYRGRTIGPSDPMYIPLRPGVITKPVSLRSPAFSLWNEKSVGSKEKDADRVAGQVGGIYEISLMCRSDFGKQEGDFELYVAGIGATRVEVTGATPSVAWDGVGSQATWRVIRLAEATGLLRWLECSGAGEMITKLVIRACAACQWVLRFFSQERESSVRLP